MPTFLSERAEPRTFIFVLPGGGARRRAHCSVVELLPGPIPPILPCKFFSGGRCWEKAGKLLPVDVDQIGQNCGLLFLVHLCPGQLRKGAGEFPKTAGLLLILV